MSDVTTVSGNRFPVYDVTHKPKRYQSDNLRKAQTDRDAQDEPVQGDSAIPQSVTIESAISYFESNAVGEYRSLYSSTAMWLRSVLSAKNRTSRHSEVDDTANVEKDSDVE